MRTLRRKENVKMKKQWFAITITVATATTALLVLFGLIGGTGSGISAPVLAAPHSLTVTDVAPAAAPNDIDTPIVIHGTGFTAALSGAVVITAPTVTLGDEALPGVIWVNTTTLSATVPWGMGPQVYSLTVVNPDGISATLASAFTVTNGIGVFTTNGPYGGDIRDMYKKPGTPTTVYALVTQVGLFVSENAGERWELIYNGEGWCAGHSFVFDAQDSDVIYLGSQLARTMDGGETWERLWIFPDIPGGWPCSIDIPVAHPSLGQVVYGGVGCDGIDPAPGEAGVFRSDDYGETWITKTNGMTDTNIWALAIHPNTPQTMLAGTHNGLLYTSLDGGENWSLSGQITGTVARVYFNPYEPLEVWAASSTAHDQAYLFRSTDLTTWELVLKEENRGGGVVSWDLNFLSDTIWTALSQVYTSTDNGDTWNEIEHLGGNAIEVTPDNPQEIYAAAGIGIRKSNDGGVNWQDSNNGLAGQFPYLLATSPLDPDLIYVKTRQGIYRSFNGGYAWQNLDYGGGGWPAGDYLAIDPYTPTRIYLGGYTCNGDQFCIEISTDSGETWNLITSTLPLTYAGVESGVLVVAPHPQIPGRILAGNAVAKVSVFHSDDAIGMVLASDDYGQSWTFMGPTQPISFIIDIAYDAVDPNLVYMATAGSGHWKSTDGGATWRKLPYIGDGWIFDEIAPHPTLSGHVVIAVGNNEGLFSSQDAGETWMFLTDSVGSPLVYAPTVPPTLYGQMERSQYSGLMRSFDNGQTWEQVADAPYPVRLATASDGERVVLYIGSPGGLASQAGAQTTLASRAVVEQSTLLGGGVYRLTTRLPTDWVYLPLVVRGYAP
jgi:photosystem II stability/assembly factor-like uncharacterized protein